MEKLSTIADLVIASGALSLLCLLALHFVSPEFKPGWRMVSEYALGKHKQLLTLFFVLWAACSLLCACLLWKIVTSPWGMVGAGLVLLSGIGALMGGLFDVRHPFHGLSFMFGIPTLPVGALLVSYHLVGNESWALHESSILLSAHAVWISLVMMAASMALLFSGFKKAGIPTDKNSEPPKTLPEGVIGVNGYANRLLVVCYIGWLIWIAKCYLSI